MHIRFVSGSLHDKSVIPHAQNLLHSLQKFPKAVVAAGSSFLFKIFAETKDEKVFSFGQELS